jgi:hypothetical protein
MVGKAIMRATSSSYSSQRAVTSSCTAKSFSSWSGSGDGFVIGCGSPALVTRGRGDGLQFGLRPHDLEPARDGAAPASQRRTTPPATPRRNTSHQ